MAHTPNSKPAHIATLTAGIVALVVLFALPGGPISYLAAIVAGLSAVTLGHYATRRPGPLWWASFLGLVLAYLEVIVACALMLVRITRTLAG